MTKEGDFTNSLTVVVVWLIVTVVVQSSTERTALNLAVFVPTSGKWPIGNVISPAAQIAAKDINDNSKLLEDYEIRLSYHDSGCDQGVGFLEMIRTITATTSIDGIIGDGCDLICEPFGLLASEMELPMVSWGCTSIALTDKKEYTTFARTVGQRHDTVRVIMGLLRHFSWQRIGMIYTSEDVWEWMAQTIKTEFEVG